MKPSPFSRLWIPRRGGMLAAGALATVAILAGAHPLMAAGEREAAVTIDNFTFTPPVITVAAGTRITWTNHDDIPHTVVGAESPRTLRSAPLDTDDQFSFTFAVPGNYRYFCSLHPHMQGMVVVR